MRPDAHVAIHLRDYAPPAHVITHAALLVSLHPTATQVRATLSITPKAAAVAPLLLDGEGLELVAISIDGSPLAATAYTYADRKLTILSPPQQPYTLVIEQVCNPQANTALSGLYLSNGVYCTQMEAEGFRRFAFFQDRPDVMATFDVRIEGPASLPVLLCNGNPGRSGIISGTDRHYAEWQDPHPKPSYLFALVAGDLASVHDAYVTQSGRKVSLGIYVEKGKGDRCAWAMESLKASMRWDETAFGREYDLDVFNIVAVSDFNMGAMENKGLNVFNDKYILARPDTATDLDFERIEAIIAHEYFHNWTGNRITCRDWFQLCLKEGLTVFRDQEFTSDLRSRAVKRIQDVRTLRARQFPEDQGPLAHPVRPESYIEINNFYTPTVYEKGAELCRMMKTLIGEKAFRKAMDLYFERHDGEAATVEDFVRCMADASGRDFSHFFQWYRQSGTPVVTVKTRHDAAARTFDVELTQETPPTPGQAEKAPLLVPLGIGLVDARGRDMPLHLDGKGALNTPLIELREQRQVFRFVDVAERPRLSLNRGFTAPVILKGDAGEDDLAFLIGHDSDSFNRWEAAQTMSRGLLLKAVASGGAAPDVSAYAAAVANVLRDESLDDAFKALMLALPPEAEIAATIGHDVNADHVVAGREAVRKALAVYLMADLVKAHARTSETGAYKPDTEGTARRSLHFSALSLIAAGDPERGAGLVTAAFDQAQNMTAEMGALGAGLGLACIASLLERFIARHGDDHLLVDKWLMMVAQVPRPGAAARVEAMTIHPHFKWTTPNRVYALIGGLGGNFAGFHAGDGEGYRVLADAVIRLNGINPQVAARMATCFRSWRQFDQARLEHAEAQMRRILATQSLSPDVFEIVSKTVSG
ncbi:MAG: aminopeptidase N [Proteobacteria bacterium]|nr:aminopeptidase N [Pseudomonadota bacterium]